jgi:hypothetical protein
VNQPEARPSRFPCLSNSFRSPQAFEKTALVHFIQIAAIDALLDLNFLGACVGDGDFVEVGLKRFYFNGVLSPGTATSNALSVIATIE